MGKRINIGFLTDPNHPANRGHSMRAEEQKPTVGRIVHYVSYGTPGGEYGSECRAAVITAVDGKQPASAQILVSLCVLNPTGAFFNEHVRYDDNALGGTWHWPERVE